REHAFLLGKESPVSYVEGPDSIRQILFERRLVAFDRGEDAPGVLRVGVLAGVCSERALLGCGVRRRTGARARARARAGAAARLLVAPAAARESVGGLGDLGRRGRAP